MTASGSTLPTSQNATTGSARSSSVQTRRHNPGRSLRAIGPLISNVIVAGRDKATPVTTPLERESHRQHRDPRRPRRAYSAAVLDLDAYLERIGLAGRPSLHDVHFAHATSIPFENLDPHRGVPVSLAPEDLEQKLIHQRRGGYCFEQNLLLAHALEALGLKIDLMLARVRLSAPAGHLRPRSHLVLRVHADGQIWHADVGFGLGTLLRPIPFGPGIQHDQSGWQFRVVQDGSELLLRTLYADGEWRDLYGFVPDPAPLVDLEVSNWYASTYPRSPFVTGLTVAVHHSDGSRLVIDNWEQPQLSEQHPTGTKSVAIRRDEVPGLLATRFGLHGFTLGPDERLVMA